MTYALYISFCLLSMDGTATECREERVKTYRTFEACQEDAISIATGGSISTDDGFEMVGTVCRLDNV